MERQIKIHSDYESLSALHKIIRRKYIRNQIKANKRWIDYFLISIVVIVCSFFLTDYKQDIIILTVLSVIGLVGVVLYILFVLVKHYLKLRRYNKEFIMFTKRYTGIPVVSYNIYQEALEYAGELHDTYKWSDFLDFLDNDDSFWLITDNVERNIWIPRSVVINPEDYDYFKEFARGKISRTHA
jgi:hypothetical protein